MVTHYFTLEALCRELDPLLRGRRILDLFTQQKNELIIRLEPNAREAESALAVSVEPSLNYCCLRDAFARAKKNSVSLFSEIDGTIIESFTIVPNDRIVLLRVTSGLLLHFRLFNTVRSNIFLVDRDGQALGSFKQGEEHIGTVRTGAAGESAAPVPETLRDFSGRLTVRPDAAVYMALKHALPLFGSTFAREALHRARIAEDLPAGSLDPDAVERLYDAATAIDRERREPRPALYYRGDVPSVFSVIPLEHLADARTEEFDDVNRGVRTCIARLFRADRIDTEKERLMVQLKRIATTVRRSLDAAAAQQTEAARAPLYEQYGSLLMSNLGTLGKGMREAVVPDLFAGQGEVRIALDPKLPPVKNAERYFEKAKKARLAAKEMEERAVQLAARDTLLATMLLHLDQCRTLDEVKEFTAHYAKELHSMHISDHAGGAKEEEQFPFRRFTVAGGYEVWVGKNSANNDLLTMKYAKPNDLWFHARGSSGSHTVLKVTDTSRPVPKEAIQAAAAIAAWYSKMRSAGQVPVAWCERKYVRKGKGQAEGAVYLDREKVVLVKPKLPEENRES